LVTKCLGYEKNSNVRGFELCNGKVADKTVAFSVFLPFLVSKTRVPTRNVH